MIMEAICMHIVCPLLVVVYSWFTDISIFLHSAYFGTKVFMVNTRITTNDRCLYLHIKNNYIILTFLNINSIQ